jgi:hypothetical protein
VLKGRLTDGGKTFLAGLKLRNAIDVENLCSCRDSRVRGIICAHSLAVGLQVIKPVTSGPIAAPPDQIRRSSPSRRQTDEEPRIELTLEGSLRHLEAEIHFRYTQPDVGNSARETEAIAELVGYGFAEDSGKAVLRGEDAILRFFSAGRRALSACHPRLRSPRASICDPRPERRLAGLSCPLYRGQRSGLFVSRRESASSDRTGPRSSEGWKDCRHRF